MKHPEPAGLPRSPRIKTPRPASERRPLRLIPGDETDEPGPREGSDKSAGAGGSRSQAQAQLGRRARPALNLLSLVAATFFVVSGGPYGLEEIVASHGYGRSLVLLCIVPLVWSLPTALLVGELASALPKEGGFYAWTQRALGPFWGVQQAWMSLAMSLFDMAIYPTLLVTYLGRLFPALADTSLGTPGWWAGFAMIALSVFWNIRGSRAVGYASLVLGAALLLPFVAMLGATLLGFGPVSNAEAFALLSAPAPQDHNGLSGAPLWIGGVMLCMWNYMGWEFASTVASEVERPQRTYPKAMIVTVILVAACYVLPILAATKSGLPATAWTTGSWVDVGRRLGGEPMAWAVGIGGALCGLGMFNVLVMSYSRLPVALAHDGFLPRWIGYRSPKSGAPTYAILLAAVLYAACMGLGFRHLVEIDVLLYGAVLTLEFVSLIVLRLREPELARPFRIRGGVAAIVLMAALPLGLLAVAMYAGRHEKALWGLSSLELGGLIISGGPILYLLQRLLELRSGRRSVSAPGSSGAYGASSDADLAVSASRPGVSSTDAGTPSAAVSSRGSSWVPVP